ncbi:MAG: 2-C-methyl-D-erythritol 4-phosphate cytidylyltransferase [Candidatus Omnitrophica bacterium]|nr:2-C-methyl-D-erythritol 4-phosphate cytidylyltransferase [Candidatus Omnitrophota bacterium]
MRSKVGVIIVSAGRGKRLAKGDKAVLQLEGQPLFCKSLNTFSTIKEIAEIMLVLRKSNFALAKKCVKGEKVKLIEGGARRADSVLKGLLALSEDIEYVLIHDGARPFVTKKTILYMLDELKKHSAVICGLKCPDTLKLVKKGVVKKTLDRSDVYLIQTPQGFKKKVIVSAYKKFRKRTKLLTGLTDDAQMLEILGKKVKVIPGDLLNFKITYSQDVKLAKIICDEKL